MNAMPDKMHPAQVPSPKVIRPTPYRWRDPSTIPPRKFVYGKHLIRSFVSLTVSPGGLGKSSMITAETLAMVTGRDLLGDRPPHPLRVWVWNGEDPTDELDRRFQAACLHYGIKPEDLGDRYMSDSGRDVPIALAEVGQMAAGGRSNRRRVDRGNPCGRGRCDDCRSLCYFTPRS